MSKIGRRCVYTLLFCSTLVVANYSYAPSAEAKIGSEHTCLICATNEGPCEDAIDVVGGNCHVTTITISGSPGGVGISVSKSVCIVTGGGCLVTIVY